MRVLLLKNLTDRTGRKYTKEELLYELIKLDKPLIGEIGSNSGTTINLASASHKISNIMFDKNNDLYGDMETLDTPIGNMLRALIEAAPDSVRFGMRSLGRVNKDRTVFDLKIITFDAYLNKLN